MRSTVTGIFRGVVSPERSGQGRPVSSVSTAMAVRTDERELVQLLDRPPSGCSRLQPPREGGQVAGRGHQEVGARREQRG